MTDNVIATKPCQECGMRVDHRKLHPLVTPDAAGREGKEIELCSKCCPNCFGGPGRDQDAGSSDPRRVAGMPPDQPHDAE